MAICDFCGNHSVHTICWNCAKEINSASALETINQKMMKDFREQEEKITPDPEYIN